MEYDGHYIDDPLMVVNAKPDFSGMGLDPNTTELRPKKKTVRPKFKKARNHGNRKS